METEQWVEKIIEYLTKKGWKLDKNEGNDLFFSFYVDEDHEWHRDYDKEKKRFVYYNGRQKINIRTTTECGKE